MQVSRGVVLSLMLAGLVAHLVSAQQRNPAADWPTYNRDLAGTRYSPLTQINTKNVSYDVRPVPEPRVRQRRAR